MKKFLIFIFGLYLGILVFMPKDNLYFTLQKYLKTENIYINSSIKSNLLKLSLENGTIYANNIDIVLFKNIEIYPFLLFNLVEINNLKLNIGNYKITNLKAYILPYPTIFIKGSSNFGTIDGKIDLIKRYAKIYIINPVSSIKSFLKKDKKGYFYYAKF